MFNSLFEVGVFATLWYNAAHREFLGVDYNAWIECNFSYCIPGVTAPYEDMSESMEDEFWEGVFFTSGTTVAEMKERALQAEVEQWERMWV